MVTKETMPVLKGTSMDIQRLKFLLVLISSIFPASVAFADRDRTFTEINSRLIDPCGEIRILRPHTGDTLSGEITVEIEIFKLPQVVNQLVLMYYDKNGDLQVKTIVDTDYSNRPRPA